MKSDYHPTSKKQEKGHLTDSRRASAQSRVSHWPFFILFGVIALLLIMAGAWLHHHEMISVKQDKYNELKAIADLKVGQIQAWRRERMTDAERNAAGPFIRETVRRWIGNPADSASKQEIINYLEMVRRFEGYENLILTGIDGRLLIALDPRLTRLDDATLALVSQAVSAKKNIFGDFLRCQDGDHVHLDLAVPFMNTAGQPVAVLILRNAPETYLYPLVQSWPLPSRSAETLLIRKKGEDALFLNPLRHRTDPPLTIRIPLARTDLPAAQAIQGRDGVYEGKDYRGVEVLSDIRPVPGTPWFMVAKVDAAEIFAEAAYRARMIGLVTLLLLMLSGAGAAVIYKHNTKRAFQALYISERERTTELEQFRVTLYSIGDAVITTDYSGRVRQMNPVAETLTGWTESDAAGKPIIEVFRIINEETRLEVENPVTRVLKEGKIVGLANHTLLIARDGMERPIADSGAPIRSEDGEITGVVLVFRVQTEERAAQLALEKSEERYRIIAENMADVITILDMDLRFTYVSPSIPRLRGYTAEEAITQSLDRIMTPESLAEVSRVFDEEMRLEAAGTADPGKFRILELEEYKKDGSIVWTENKVSFLRDKKQEPVGILCVTRDITERRRALKALRESEARFRQFYEQSPVAYQALDAVGNILDINRKWLNEMGYGREDVIGKWFGEYLTEEGMSVFLECFNKLKLVDEVHGIEFGIRRKDGHYIQASFEGRLGRDITGAFSRVHCVFVNITEKKKAERERRFLADIINSSLNEIYIFDGITLRFRYANEGALQNLGYPPTGVRELTPLDLKPDFTPETFRELIQPLIDGEKKVQVFRTRHRRADGSHYPIEANLQYFNYEGDRVFLSSIQDITARQSLEDQLLQAQKMESVGRLAGGVAHDFNNMLGVIIGHAEMALEQADPAHTLFADLMEIRTAAQRSADLTRQLLAFARKQTVNPKNLDLNEEISGMLKMLRRLIGEDISLIWKPGPSDLWPVRIDPVQISQILANLLINAKDAIPGVGNVTIEMKNITLDETYAESHAGFIPGAYVMMAVSDSGVGIDNGSLEHIFDPFYTTKEVGKGTGLGLSTVYGIVKQNDGFINVYSEPNRGTTFRIYLPRTAGEEIREGLKEEIKPGRLSGNETVLLVEDEQQILKLAESILKRYGYTLMKAGTPGEALTLVENHKGHIELLISDVVMPEMNGKELRDKLIAFHPEMKCLFMSGYTADVIASHGVLEEGFNFLQKPFSVRTLAEKVREVLDGDNAPN